jgi:hypothetical protein
MAVHPAEFDYLLKVLLRLSELMHPGYDLATDIKSWQAQFTPYQQRQGLQEGLVDLAEEGAGLPTDKRRQIDDTMKSEGLMTLTELQVRHGRRIKRLLKKKKLIREDDAIALKGFLDSGLLNEADTETATQLIENFGG